MGSVERGAPSLPQICGLLHAEKGLGNLGGWAGSHRGSPRSCSVPRHAPWSQNILHMDVTLNVTLADALRRANVTLGPSPRRSHVTPDPTNVTLGLIHDRSNITPDWTNITLTYVVVGRTSPSRRLGRSAVSLHIRQWPSVPLDHRSDHGPGRLRLALGWQLDGWNGPCLGLIDPTGGGQTRLQGPPPGSALPYPGIGPRSPLRPFWPALAVRSPHEPDGRTRRARVERSRLNRSRLSHRLHSRSGAKAGIEPALAAINA